MPNFKEYTKKLASLGNTLKMTRTMKMVAAGKLRKAQEAQRQAKQYAHTLGGVLGRLAAAAGQQVDHPLLHSHGGQGQALLLVYTSDRGLCGGFNNNLLRAANAWLAQQSERYPRLEVSCCGRRGFIHYRRRLTVRRHYEGLTAHPDYRKAAAVADEVMRDFQAGAFETVYLAYNSFLSPLSQRPVIQQLLPIVPEAVKAGDGETAPDYLFEPSPRALLDLLIPRTVQYEVYFALLENSAGEHGARMTAMDSATSNAEKMIDDYTLRRNRARQAAITKEVIEIVAGAQGQ